MTSNKREEASWIKLIYQITGKVASKSYMIYYIYALVKRNVGPVEKCGVTPPISPSMNGRSWIPKDLFNRVKSFLLGKLKKGKIILFK
jgi:hypothetical protein